MYVEQTDELDGITMMVSSVTAEGATIVCTNSTDKVIVLGDDYELQVWREREEENGVWHREGWHQVKYAVDDAAFDSVGYPLLRDMPLDWEVNWTYFHGILPAGHYRITKSALDVCGTESVIKYNLAAEFRGLVANDFDLNGQRDIAIMVQAHNLPCYGAGYIYFYMNGEKPYRFYEEYFAFGRDLYVFGTELDNDGYTELVFGAAGTGCGLSGDWYNRILKYKNHTMEKMEIPTEETQDIIEVVVAKEEEENAFSAYCDYLDDEIVFETYNPDMENYGGWGTNYRGFYDIRCVEYEDRYALEASVMLSGCGNSNCVGNAKFLIVWDGDGNGHFEKWWIEPHYHERERE